MAVGVGTFLETAVMAVMVRDAWDSPTVLQPGLTIGRLAIQTQLPLIAFKSGIFGFRIRSMETEEDPISFEQLAEQARLNRQKDIWTLNFGIFALFSGALLFYFWPDLAGSPNRFEYEFNRNLAIFFGLAGVATGIALLTTLYARGFELRPRDVVQDPSGEVITLNELGSLVQKIEENSRTLAERRNLSAKDEEVVRSHIETAISKGLSKAIIETIERKYGRSVRYAATGDSYSKYFDGIIGKIELAKVQTRRSATVYLGWGVVTTVAGILLLGSMVFLMQLPQGTGTDKYLVTGSRIALFLAVEAIGVFFLRQFNSGIKRELLLESAISKFESAKLAYLTGTRLGNEEFIGSALEYAKIAADYYIDTSGTPTKLSLGNSTIETIASAVSKKG